MFACIIAWLRNHSVSVEQVGNEMRFKHSDLNSSILVLKETWIDGLIPVDSELLRSLFDDVLAASIGNGHIIIGSTVQGGIDVSHGYRIPDLHEIRRQAVGFGMTGVIAAEVFMIEASWMFLYGLNPKNDQLLRFDHDFGSCEYSVKIEDVLLDWWQISISR